MTLTVSSQPYEFLARWKDGVLAGAHIQRIYITRDGDTIVSEAVGQVQPVALDGNGAYPLADIMTEVQAGAVAQANALVAQVDEARAERDAAKAERDGLAEQMAAAAAERDAALARVAELEAGQPSG